MLWPPKTQRRAKQRGADHTAARHEASIRPSRADALLEDYKLKFQYSTDVLNRYQTQLQIMPGLQAAIATALILSSSGRLSSAARWIVLVELVLSVVWLSVGLQGFFRVRNSKQLALTAGKEWSSEVGLENYLPPDDGRGTARVGWVAPTVALLIWLVVAWYLWR